MAKAPTRKRTPPKATPRAKLKALPIIADPPPNDLDLCPDTTSRVTVLESTVALATINAAPNGSMVYVNEGVLTVLNPPGVDSTLKITAAGGLYWDPD